MDKKYIDKPGKYVCKVKEPGNGWLDYPEGKAPFIRIPCVVDMPAIPAKGIPQDPQHGHEAVWYGYLSEKSRERTEETLRKVFNWDGSWDESWVENPDDEEDAPYGLNAFIGQSVRLQCDESEWQGNIRIKARWLNPAATKKQKNREEYDKKRKSVLEQLKKDYPHLAIGGKHTPKTHDDEGDAIPF
jgi:hypothetical protein